MKKKSIGLILVTAMVFFVGGTLYAEYNRAKVVEVMHNNVVFLNNLKSAVSAKDYYSAAVALMGMAEGSYAIKDYVPPQGSSEEWKTIHEEIIRVAFIGIGACGRKDIDGVRGALNSILSLKGKGHRAYK